MPGRREALEDLWERVGRCRVNVIVNLTSEGETRTRSPRYAEALAGGTVPCDVWQLPIIDDGVPDVDADFEKLLRRIADGLRRGASYLVHCNAGVGRTGTVATGILMVVGVPIGQALRTVQAAGSGPSTHEQRAILTRLAGRLSRTEPLV
jgi:protein-tyrosine phosphatase